MRPGQALAAAVILLYIAGCGGGGPLFATWASRGERLPRAAPWPVEELPPADVVPWAGTVSHHLLADELIDRWFAELARRRSVRVFYILSPSHWGLSTQRYSLTDGSWQVPGSEVGSDRRRVAGLARGLGVALDPTVFEDEHGVSTLMPYLARHFPRARVVVVACRGEPPLDQPAALALARTLAPAFDRAGRHANFLLVSADFAHHGDAAGTAVKDERSRRFFDAPSLDTWIFAGCDNRPAMYVLAYLAGPATVSSVLYHADSLGLSGLGRDDITTYFFTYFWDRQQ